MIYYLYDARYLGWTYPTKVWTEPNAANQNAGTSRVLRECSKQMLAVEMSEPDDRALGETAQRVCIDFFTNTVLVFIDHEEEALIWDIDANRKAWSDDRVSDIARARMVALASLYAKLCKTNKRRAVELAFQTTLRGPVGPVRADDTTPEETEKRRQQWLDAMNEFDLGVVVHFLFRPPAYSSYLPHDRFDKLLEDLEQYVKAIGREEGPMGLARNPNSPPAPAPAPAPGAPDEEGPARKHDKGPRAARWAGPRSRAGGLCTGRAGAESAPARPLTRARSRRASRPARRAAGSCARPSGRASRSCGSGSGSCRLGLPLVRARTRRARVETRYFYTHTHTHTRARVHARRRVYAK